MSCKCNWIVKFLTLSTVNLNFRAPQSSVLSPFLFTLYTDVCIPQHEENSVKFADSATIIGSISNRDEGSYLEEINSHAE